MNPSAFSSLPAPSPLLAGLSALAAIVVAAVVLNRDPRRAENQFFFALVLLNALANLNAASLFFGPTPDPLSSRQFSLVIALGGLSMFALVLFAHAFPFNRRPTRLLFWGLGALAVIEFVLTLQRFSSPVALWYSRGYIYLCATLAVLFVSRNYRDLPTPSERAGLLLVQSVILSRFVLSALAYGLPRADGQPDYLLLVVHLIIAPPLMSSAMGYGLTRFQLLGLRFFLSRSLAYFLVSTTALALYVGVIILTQNYLRQLLELRSASFFTTPLLLILLMVTFHPVRIRVEDLLDRWLDRGFVRAREAAETYFSRSQGALGVRALHRVVRETTRAILPGSRLALVMARPSPRLLTLDGVTRFLPTGWKGEVGTVTGELVATDEEVPVEYVSMLEGDALRDYFQRSRRSYLQKTPLRAFPRDLPAGLGSLKADVMVPFWREGQVDGVMLIQAPDIDRERIGLLIELARHLGLQLENTLLYQQAIEANEALTREKQTLEDTRAFLESMFEAVPAGIAVVDSDGRVVKWNRGMERLTGLARQVALASETDITRLLPGLGLHGEDTEAVRGLTTPLQRRIRLSNQDNDLIVHMRLAFFKDRKGKLGGTVLILTDVTQQLAMQEALEASKRLAALGQFAAAMAHEIRTPMTSIQMNVQILAGKVELPPEDYEYFDIILTELERLNRTVGEILDFAKPMRLDAVELELHELIHEVVRGMYFLLAERGVEVSQEAPEGLSVQADGERLKQVLINLLDNASHAIEENPARGESDTPAVVRVVGRATKVGGTAGVVLEVIDTGSGMPEETLRHIFDPFYTTRPKGTGLGLAIAKKIAEAHGGQISAESVAGEGSTFRLWLPVRGRG